jgi:hypothetical protein
MWSPADQCRPSQLRLVGCALVELILSIDVSLIAAGLLNTLLIRQEPRFSSFAGSFSTHHVTVPRANFVMIVLEACNGPVNAFLNRTQFIRLFVGRGWEFGWKGQDQKRPKVNWYSHLRPISWWPGEHALLRRRRRPGSSRGQVEFAPAGLEYCRTAASTTR